MMSGALAGEQIWVAVDENDSNVPPMHHLPENDHWNGEIEMRNIWKHQPLS